MVVSIISKQLLYMNYVNVEGKILLIGRKNTLLNFILMTSHHPILIILIASFIIRLFE